MLREWSAPGFQTANSQARLADIFANLRAQQLDLSAVSVLEPQLTLLPQIDNAGNMRMAGFFPSVPLQVNFDLAFAAIDGRWRLNGISLNVGAPGPVAPNPPPQPAPAPVQQNVKPEAATKQPALPQRRDRQPGVN